MGSDRIARIIIRIVGVAGLLGLLVAIMVGGERPLSSGAAPAVDNARLLDGRLANLKLVQGHPVVVNIWATWCPPCLQELPELAAAARDYGDKVTFYGLAVDSDRAQMQELKERIPIPYDIAEIDGATARAWNATSIPDTYILDGRGQVVWSIRGSIDRHLLDEHLKPLLASP